MVNLLFTLFSVTMGYKYVKLGSKAYRKQPIYCESLQKIPLSSDFSKNGPSSDFENTRFTNLGPSIIK